MASLSLWFGGRLEQRRRESRALQNAEIAPNDTGERQGADWAATGGQGEPCLEAHDLRAARRQRALVLATPGRRSAITAPRVFFVAWSVVAPGLRVPPEALAPDRESEHEARTVAGGARKAGRARGELLRPFSRGSFLRSTCARRRCSSFTTRGPATRALSRCRTFPAPRLQTLVRRPDRSRDRAPEIRPRRGALGRSRERRVSGSRSMRRCMPSLARGAKAYDPVARKPQKGRTRRRNDSASLPAASPPRSPASPGRRPPR